MVFLRLLARSGALIVLGAAVAPWSSLQGQRRPARVIVAPRGQPRIATIAPPPPPPQPLTTYGQTVFTTYPTIVTADGRILVDLGNGYEEVARTCPYAYGYGCRSYGYPPAPLTPLFQEYVPSGYVAPRYAPPAYAAPVYPVPSYGDGSYGYPSPGPDYGPPPYTPPPSTGYGGCPPGYVPTGAYPPCIDPDRSPAQNAPMPSRRRGGTVPAPRRGPPSAGSGAHVVTRRP
jgi:hypothetical protein